VQTYFQDSEHIHINHNIVIFRQNAGKQETQLERQGDSNHLGTVTFHGWNGMNGRRQRFVTHAE
jgi:hypothetical protein